VRQRREIARNTWPRSIRLCGDEPMVWFKDSESDR